MIIGAETFNDSRYEGNPKTSKVFRNSIHMIVAIAHLDHDLFLCDTPLQICHYPLPGAVASHTQIIPYLPWKAPYPVSHCRPN